MCLLLVYMPYNRIHEKNTISHGCIINEPWQSKSYFHSVTKKFLALATLLSVGENQIFAVERFVTGHNLSMK